MPAPIDGRPDAVATHSLTDVRVDALDQPRELDQPPELTLQTPPGSADRDVLVVAVDGPSGSGKSTVARGVATALGLRYLDTGAVYRALTWLVLRNGLDLSDHEAIEAAAANLTLEISTDPAHAEVGVDGVEVTSAIRGGDVTAAVSAVSAIPAVRTRLVGLQRHLIGAGGIVVEGRDIGTHVCPDAPVKIFLTAAADARARRRSLELAGAAVTSDDVALVRADLERRDRLDTNRQASPLAQAPDAVVLDSTALDARGVIAAVLNLVQERTGVVPLATAAVGE